MTAREEVVEAVALALALHRGKDSYGEEHVREVWMRTNNTTFRDQAVVAIAAYQKATGETRGEANSASSQAERVAALEEALKQAEAFIAVMFGIGPDAIIPDNITSPIGINIFLGGIMREIRAALAKGKDT